MKIVFFARRFYPLIGGVEKHVWEISIRLVKKGHHVIVITEASDKKSKGKEIIDGIEIHRLFVGKEEWFKKIRIWKSLWKKRKLITSADVIHCHDVFFWYLPYRFIYPKKSVYTTFHGYESYPISAKAIRMRKLSEKLSLGNICIGDFIKKWYGTKPTIVSYGAVASQASSASFRSARNDIKKESALFFGRFDEQTGIKEYVKTFDILKKKYPKFEFLMVGDGDYKITDKRIKTVGFQNNPERYFPQYHFAFVSRYLSILEAFAAKRLVVATYDNPVKEDYLRLAPFAKWIIIEKDPGKIAKRVIDMIENPKHEQKIINEAYIWATKQTWEKMVGHYLSLWKLHDEKYN